VKVVQKTEQTAKTFIKVESNLKELSKPAAQKGGATKTKKGKLVREGDPPRKKKPAKIKKIRGLPWKGGKGIDRR